MGCVAPGKEKKRRSIQMAYYFNTGFICVKFMG
jgi:hypothetical protein